MRALVFGSIGVLWFASLAPGVLSAAPEPYDSTAGAAAPVWVEIASQSPWEGRAGLQVVEREGTFYLMGGRTPKPPAFPPIPGDSTIWSDVWESDDRGVTWTRIRESDTPGGFPPRAYFQALTVGRGMVVMGGQNFKAGPAVCPPGQFLCSDFFNDVWGSLDGSQWTELTAQAGWEPRAGLSAVVLDGEVYVMGGSQGDDEALGGQGRILFNDVWKSSNGRDWIQLTAAAPWAPRAGAVGVIKDGEIFLLGGEDGFTCTPLPCDPPYFNDVWKSANGADWELVTEAAGWSPRPGHQCVVVAGRFFCFGGFGLSQDPDNPFEPSNPVDLWFSEDGANWTEAPITPWNATGPEEIKYDFKALSVVDEAGPAIYTFGGDRETFDFTDPLNYLRVDNDVWRLGRLP